MAESSETGETDAIVLTSWERRRQAWSFALLLFVPLPLASYYARARWIGRLLLATFVASIGLAVALDAVSLLIFAIAAKAVDAWLGPVLLAQHQRRDRSWLPWVLVLPIYGMGGFYVLEQWEHHVAKARELQDAVALVPAIFAGKMKEVPLPPSSLRSTLELAIVLRPTAASWPVLALFESHDVPEQRIARLAERDREEDTLRWRLARHTAGDPQATQLVAAIDRLIEADLVASKNEQRRLRAHLAIASPRYVQWPCNHSGWDERDRLDRPPCNGR